MKKILPLLMALLPGAVTVAAENPLVTWSGQFRMRGEIDIRDFRRGNALNTYALSRIRLGARIAPAPRVSAFLQVQDSRVFGEEKETSGQFSTLAHTRNLDLHQGFLQIDSLFESPIRVRLGRMELKYGSERIIGAVDWHNVGRSFDGLLVRLQTDRTSADAFVMRTGETRIPPGAATPSAVAAVRDDGQTLYGLTTTSLLGEGSMLDLIALYQTHLRRTATGEAELTRATVGTSVRTALGRLSLEGEAASQFGKKGGKNIRTYLLAGSASFRTGASFVEAVRAGAEVLSGTPEGSDEVRTFDPPYATGHKFHGWMDYFINIPDHTYNGGMLDLSLGSQGRIGEDVSYTVRAHSFALMQARSGKKNLGQEIDLLLRYQADAPLSIDVGLSAFLPGPVQRKVFGGADAGFWAFCAATLSF